MHNGSTTRVQLTGGIKVPDGEEDEQESDDDPREVLGHQEGLVRAVQRAERGGV